MQARMKTPVMLFPGAMQAMSSLSASTENSGLSEKTAKLVQLRASQINGCSVCVDMHARELKLMGEADERLFTVAAWRDAPYFTDAERAALELTEAVTRLSDHPDPVTDDMWERVKRHYDERSLGALLLNIAIINVWNRLNAATRQVAGEWIKSAEGQPWMENHAQPV